MNHSKQKTLVTERDNPAYFLDLKGSVTYSMLVGGLNIRGKASVLPAGIGNVPTIAFLADVFEQGLAADQIYRLKAGSPAVGIGLNGVDMGMFGGATPYLISGVPARPRITHLVSPSSATSTSGLRFEVEAKSF